MVASSYRPLLDSFLFLLPVPKEAYIAVILLIKPLNKYSPHLILVEFIVINKMRKGGSSVLQADLSTKQRATTTQ